MARIKPEKENSKDPEIQKIFAEIKRATDGKVPEAYRVFARAPRVLAANWNRTKNILGAVKIQKTEKESIALAVSAANGCDFCVKIHSENLKKSGFKKSEIEKIKTGKSENPTRKMILEFCVKAMISPKKVADADFEKIKKLGFDDSEILEILATAEMYSGYNRLLIALGI